MIKRVIWVIVIILITAYVINNYLQKRSKEKEKKAEEKRIEIAVKRSVADLVKVTNAIDGWEQVLSKGETYRMAPILTVELEKLWMAGRPIIFIGSIKDIVTLDKENYQIEIGRSLFNFKHFFGTKLLLLLKCPKPKIDSFLKAHPDIFKEMGFMNGVAVVADIKNIDTKRIHDDEGETHEAKIGVGNCIDLAYTGNVLF